MRISLSLLAAGLVLAAPVPALLAATPAEMAAGSAVMKKYADAIVMVELVAVTKPSSGGTPREQKVEANATMISADGLALTSFALINATGGRGGRGGGGETEFKEVKLRLADNTEIPARVVLKDPDFDLAFIAPETGAAEGRTFTHVNVEAPAEPTVLGTFYSVTRVTKLLQRAPIVQISSIAGIVEKPRRIIITDQHTPACPVFDAEGKVLGFSLNYVSGGTGIGYVVVPTADVAAIAQQAVALVKQPASAEPKL